MVTLSFPGGSGKPPSATGAKLDLEGCGSCSVDHFSTCATGILGQAVISALEITRRAVANGDAHLDPHNQEDIEYVFEAIKLVIAEDLQKAKPVLGVEMPTDAAEIAKIKAGIPDAIRQGQAVYAAVGILAAKTVLSSTKMADVDMVYKKLAGIIGPELPRVVNDAAEIAAYRKQIPYGIVTAMKAMPQPA